MECSGGHIKEQLTQMRAPQRASDVLVNRATPPLAQSGPDQLLRRGLRLWAFVVRQVVHRHGNCMNQKTVVDGEPDLHIVNGLVRPPRFLTLDFECEGFGVAHVGFNVP